jgi:hypothetical protein
MEVEYYNGAFNTGHYINHEFLTQQQLENQGPQDLADGIIRLAPGTYDYYTQWVTFEDSTYIMVSDRGPVYQGIITIAVSPDSHEAEIKAPMWGFLKTPEGVPIIDVGQDIIVSASLEASGELSEQAAMDGYTPGSKSVWGSDTAEPFRYSVVDPVTSVATNPVVTIPETAFLDQNFPNPFNPETEIRFRLSEAQQISLNVFNITGQKVATLVNGYTAAGVHRLQWQPLDSRGNVLPGGIYFLTLTGNSGRQVRSMLFLK